MKLDRRTLLSWLPPSVAAALLPASASAQSSGGGSSPTGETDATGEPIGCSSLDPSETFDVIIVGGGIAGCYTAYRLLYGDIDPDSPLGQLKAQNGGHLNVGLFEYSGRVGGRLLAAELPRQDDPDQGIGDGGSAARKYAEFGGFRFQEQMHIVRDLATLLDLEHEPFPVDEPPENFVYLRGERFRAGELSSAKLPYNFTAAEESLLKAGGDFSTYVANQAFAGVLPDFQDFKSLPATAPYAPPNGYIYLRTLYHQAFQAEQWAKVEALRDEYETARQLARVDGRGLNDWQWWNLLSYFLSSEAIAFMEDSGGYNSLWSPGNVPANLREDFYFATPGDIYPGIYETGSQQQQIDAACTETAWKHIVTGYSDIPNQLYIRFTTDNPPADWGQQNGGVAGQGFLQHQLVRFDKSSSGGYDLQFFQRESSTFGSALAEDQCEQDAESCVTVNASHLILALPKRSLELVDQRNFLFTNPTVVQLLDSVLNNPAIRLFMAYPRPWWTEAESTASNGTTYPAPTCGRSKTDLPVRQFYYWHTADPDNENQESFVLASYSNAEAEQFWRYLENGPGPFDTLKGTATAVGTRLDRARGRGPRAGSEAMAQLAHKFLVEVVGPLKNGGEPPQPYYAHFQNWVKDPWGAGWHAWTAGHNDVELIPRILQPLPDEDVFLCGECWSNVQGWVQGALNTSEVMLQKRLGLAYPSWLSPGGTWLGPGSEGIPVVPDDDGDDDGNGD